MIVKEEFLSKLRRYFGLNLYEVKIWTALLSRGVSTAGELSDIGNVPRSRAYDVLESLEKKGFVVMKLGKPIKYITIDPKEVVERVKKQIQQQADDNIFKLKELRETNILQELEQLYKQGIEFIEPTDLAGAVRGKHNLYAHLESIVKKADKSVVIASTSKGIIRKVEALKPTLQKLKKKGVSIRVAVPITKENAAAINELRGIAEVKHMDKINARFCIVDGKELMFMVMHDEDVHPSYDIGIWANTPFFANTLESLFNATWKNLSSADKKLK